MTPTPVQLSEDTALDDESQADGTPSEQRRRLRQSLIAAVLLTVLVAALVIAVPGLDSVKDRLGSIDPWWVVLAVAFEFLSCLGYVLAFQLVFARTPRIFAARVAWAEMAFGAVVPVGGAGGVALGAWLLHAKGFALSRIAQRSAVLFLVTSAVNVIVLALCGVGLALGVFEGPDHPLLGVIPAGVGIAVLIFFVTLPRTIERIIARRGSEGRLVDLLLGLASAVRDTVQLIRRPRWRLIGPIAYLAFDVGVLYVCFLAFGHAPALAPLVIAYLIGYLGNVLPIPGGIGVLDGGLIGALVIYGVPATSATTAVLVYHAIALWVPAGIGTIAFLLLRRTLSDPITLLPRERA